MLTPDLARPCRTGISLERSLARAAKASERTDILGVTAATNFSGAAHYEQRLQGRWPLPVLVLRDSVQLPPSPVTRTARPHGPIWRSLIGTNFMQSRHSNAIGRRIRAAVQRRRPPPTAPGWTSRTPPITDGTRERRKTLTAMSGWRSACGKAAMRSAESGAFRRCGTSLVTRIEELRRYDGGLAVGCGVRAPSTQTAVHRSRNPARTGQSRVRQASESPSGIGATTRLGSRPGRRRGRSRR